MLLRELGQACIAIALGPDEVPHLAEVAFGLFQFESHRPGLVLEEQLDVLVDGLDVIHADIDR